MARRFASRSPHPDVLLVTADADLVASLPVAVESAWCRICAEADDLDGALDAAEALQPDACLLDARVAGDSAEAVAILLARAPGMKVVILAEALDEADFLHAIRAGARGYLAAGASAGALAHALGDVLAGDIAAPRSLVRCLVQELLAGEQRSAR